LVSIKTENCKSHEYNIFSIKNLENKLNIAKNAIVIPLKIFLAQDLQNIQNK